MEGAGGAQGVGRRPVEAERPKANALAPATGSTPCTHAIQHSATRSSRRGKARPPRWRPGRFDHGSVIKTRALRAPSRKGADATVADFENPRDVAPGVFSLQFRTSGTQFRTNKASIYKCESVAGKAPYPQQ